MDQSFNRGSLARCLVAEDFYKDSQLSDEDYRRALVERSIVMASNPSTFAPSVSENTSSKKTIYTVDELAAKLVLRKCSRNLKFAASIRLKPRHQIIRELKTYLAEGVAYRVYRLDIASFFESCKTGQVLKSVNEYAVSTQTRNLVSNFLDYFNASFSEGIPRGIEVSPVLSEISLIEFDCHLSESPEVLYYSRFVDDIVIVTTGEESESSLMGIARAALPSGLHLNHNKKSILMVPKRSTGTGPPSDPVVAKFDYLGYSISVIDTDLSLINANKPSSLKVVEYRRVSIDLTSKKSKRIMGKVFKSFYAFTKDGDFQLLRDRLIFLTSNRDLINKRNKRKVPTGIYYSHSELDIHSPSLGNLDVLLRTLITSPSGRLGVLLASALNKSQKNNLLKLSFAKGHKDRVFKRFSPNRLRLISRVW